MGPRDERQTPQDDLFRSRLSNLLDQRHPLVKLADRMDWSVFLPVVRIIRMSMGNIRPRSVAVVS